MNNTMHAWDKARFAVERKCTCHKGNRSYECVGGWHRVDGWPTATEALKDAAELGFDNYRVTDTTNGKQVTL